MRSVRGQYKQLRLVFSLLAVLFAIQMLLLYGLHLRNNSKLLQANDNVNQFMRLVKEQNSIYKRLVESIENQSTQYLGQIREEILSLKEEVSDWGRENVEQGLLSQSLVNDEIRRLENFQDVTSKIQTGDYSTAEEALMLEKKVFYTRQSIVSSILESVISENETSEFVIQSCFLLSVLLNVPVLLVLLMISRQLFKGVEVDIDSLVNVAKSITEGADSQIPESKCLLEETNDLHLAFEDMEIALRNRSMLSKEQVTQARQSTEKLEVEVEKSNIEIHKANEQLSRKNEELEQILYAASHDLRTPLIGIQGFSQELQYLAEMLLDELKESVVDIENSEKLRDIIKQDIPSSVDFILKGSNKMDTMIQGLLRISRVGLEDFKFAEVNMDELLRQIVDGLSFQAQSANAQISVEKLEGCEADKDKIEQVFTNLIVNAIKYRNPKVDCEIKVSCRNEGEILCFDIKDNGLGISEENLKNIYKTFYRVSNSDANGEGLGLTIANRIVERHGGKLEVSSTLGEGSCFTVILPKVQKTASVGESDG
ncbi:MAG: HAMP domain-containing histidine kinase [Lentisphaerales bacterium]|nr:HAMP domain-containing histidine kinase [Lentisphaerales bacterium]